MNTAIRSRAMAPVLSRLAEIAAIVAQKVWRFLTAGHAATLPQYRPRRSRGRVFMRHSLLLVAVLGIAVVYGFLFTILPPFLYAYMAVPIGVLALAVIWALPDSDVYPDRAMRFLFFGLVLAIGLWPNYLALALPGQPWISSRRLFTIPLFVLFLISYSMSPDLRADLKAALTTSKPLWIAMLIYIALCFVTMFVSDYPATSFNKFLVAQLEWTMPFLVAVWLFQNERYVRMFVGILFFIAIYQGFIGIWEHAIQAVPWAPYVPSWLKGDVELIDQILAGSRRHDVGTHRSAGTWTTPLSYAELLAMLIPFMLLRLVETKRWISRLMVAALVILAVAAILFSQSRLGLVGLMVALVLFVLMFAVRLWKLESGNLVAPALIVAYPAIAATIVGLTFVSRRLEILVWGAGHTQSSNEGRSLQYQQGWDALLQWPLGYGMGNAADVAGTYSPSGQLTIDTYYVAIAVDVGIIGFFAYYFVFLYAGGKAGLAAIRNVSVSGAERYLMPLACTLAIYIVVKGVLSQEDTHIFVFIILGLTVALLHVASKRAPVSTYP